MRILITGAGGAAAVSVWKSLNADHELLMSDIDPCAAGLYLVPATHRIIIPRGDDPSFTEKMLQICKQRVINVLLATVDLELAVLSKQTNEFTGIGTQVPLSPYQTLLMCFDKHALLEKCKDHIPVPHYSLLNKENLTSMRDFPYFAKPRFSSGSRGAMVIHKLEELAALPQDNSYLVQELLPGDEYSVDIYVSAKGLPIAAVPRLRMKIDSGIAVASRSVNHPILSKLALDTALLVGIRYVANIQYKQARDGLFKLLEINPRFSGTLPLTIAAGVDIPKLLVTDIDNQPLPAGIMPYRELMVVRYWTEKYIATQEWVDLCQQ